MDLFASLQRREVPAEIRESLFQPRENSLLGPVRQGEAYAIIRVLSVIHATLDDVVRDTIKSILFEEWLERHRQTASIEWLWGNASNTARDARTDMAVNVADAG